MNQNLNQNLNVISHAYKDGLPAPDDPVSYEDRLRVMVASGAFAAADAADRTTEGYSPQRFGALRRWGGASLGDRLKRGRLSTRFPDHTAPGYYEGNEQRVLVCKWGRFYVAGHNMPLTREEAVHRDNVMTSRGLQSGDVLPDHSVHVRFGDIISNDFCFSPKVEEAFSALNQRGRGRPDVRIAAPSHTLKRFLAGHIGWFLWSQLVMHGKSILPYVQPPEEVYVPNEPYIEDNLIRGLVARAEKSQTDKAEALGFLPKVPVDLVEMALGDFAFSEYTLAQCMRWLSVMDKFSEDTPHPCEETDYTGVVESLLEIFAEHLSVRDHVPHLRNPFADPADIEPQWVAPGAEKPS